MLSTSEQPDHICYGNYLIKSWGIMYWWIKIYYWKEYRNITHGILYFIIIERIRSYFKDKENQTYLARKLKWVHVHCKDSFGKVSIATCNLRAILASWLYNCYWLFILCFFLIMVSSITWCTIFLIHIFIINLLIGNIY